jgi:predicted enzyme related to lactoylglutathione lyase
MDWKIELVAIPVTDVGRAKAFYVEQAGFQADHDHQVSDAPRFVQLTPPGSACSIMLGTGITQMPPGSQKGVQCVVADVEAARRELIAHGVQASDVDVQPWGSFVTFSDPDGNT